MTRTSPSALNSVPVSSRWRPFLALLALPIITGCGRISQGQELPDLGDRIIRVTATTGQVADLARQVGGERVSVDGLMGPGVDPHLFKASERNVEELIDSDAIFFNGLHLEGKLGELLERLSERRPVFPVGDAIPADLLTSPAEFQGNPDPHVWFDPTMWAYACRSMGQALTSIDPSHSQAYADGVASYTLQLDELDRYAAERFSAIPDQQRVLVTAHDAFGYLGRRYGLEVVGLQGISTSTEAGIRDVQRIADLLVERQVPSIFVETSVPRRTIEAVQVATTDRNWQVSIGGELFSDALGDFDTPEGTYLGMFRHNVDTIVAGLEGEDAE
ncbi:MAG: Manganese ABC transporter, periplasmic-binding protein SitA [uncultured Thermomicrobiales bacterium]|uniref:Manganese ABC transporter, periplasmic-binding protein SitA n=1 Tax=uncultured Thermomicrobiales bacterium TaxID=1645740 RepID=A0A6J4UEE2_9BACT|nr:MAG: Manganese ABC transporter, periplasmic-binding protein SitA [uncultured Thermomicrobiales bacterium]